MQLQWDGSALYGAQLPEPEIVDSWLVRDGRAVGLAVHQHRFSEAIGHDASAFFDAVRATIPDSGAWFPRVEWSAGQLGVRIRRAPTLRDSSRIWIPEVSDPRETPRIKGPDLAALGKLRDEAVAKGYDDAALITPEGYLVETATAAVLVWCEERTIVLPRSPHLTSTTVQVLLPLLSSRGITVRYADLAVDAVVDKPAWCANALHGITPVTAWGRNGAEIPARTAPETSAWNRALWGRPNV